MNVIGFDIDQLAEVHRMRFEDLLAEAEQLRLVRRLQESHPCRENQVKAQALLGWLRTLLPPLGIARAPRSA